MSNIIGGTISIGGDDVKELLTTDGFANSISLTAKQLAKDADEKIFSACIDISVDPKIVIKQGELIKRLQAALDCRGNEFVGCNFTTYFELIKENERLKNLLQDTE